jgi:hypothetical protein
MMREPYVFAQHCGRARSFDKRRKPRVKWVQQRSLALFAQIRQESALRNVFLGETGRATIARLLPTTDRGAIALCLGDRDVPVVTAGSGVSGAPRSMKTSTYFFAVAPMIRRRVPCFNRHGCDGLRFCATLGTWRFVMT